MKYIAAVDQSTSSSKAFLVNERGEIMRRAARAHRLYSPARDATNARAYHLYSPARDTVDAFLCSCDLRERYLSSSMLRDVRLLEDCAAVDQSTSSSKAFLVNEHSEIMRRATRAHRLYYPACDAADARAYHLYSPARDAADVFLCSCDLRERYLSSSMLRDVGLLEDCATEFEAWLNETEG